MSKPTFCFKTRRLANPIIIGSLALLSVLTGSASAGTVTLQGVTTNSCTYARWDVDAAGNMVVTCQSSGGTTPLNGVCGSANGVAATSAPTTGLCTAGSATAVTGSGPWTWSCTGADGGSTATCSAPLASTPPPTSSCDTAPSNFTVVQPGGSALGSVWQPETGTFVAQLPSGAGVALAVPVNLTAYPGGFKVTDGAGGSKSMVVSKCPGSLTPVDNQNGSSSVNGDNYRDNCAINNTYARWVNTSGATAIYYNGRALSYQTTCFLPTTTGLGLTTPATYYINILNTGITAVGVQYKNYPQLP